MRPGAPRDARLVDRWSDSGAGVGRVQPSLLDLGPLPLEIILAELPDAAVVLLALAGKTMMCALAERMEDVTARRAEFSTPVRELDVCLCASDYTVCAAAMGWDTGNASSVMTKCFNGYDVTLHVSRGIIIFGPASHEWLLRVSLFGSKVIRARFQSAASIGSHHSVTSRSVRDLAYSLPGMTTLDRQVCSAFLYAAGSVFS